MARVRASVRKGETLDLAVTGLTPDFEGVAGVDGFPVLVPGGLPGDQVRAKVLSVRPEHARAIIVELVAAGAVRRSPSCPLAGTCGGCPLMHLEYDAQVREKEARLRAVLVEAGLDEATVDAARQAPAPARHLLEYRMKGVFPLAVRGGHPIAGLYRVRSHDLVPVERCPVQGRITNRVLRPLLQLLETQRVPIYAERRRMGLLRALVFRESLAKRKLLVGLVSRRPLHPELGPLVMALDRSIAGVVNSLNPDPGNRVLGREEHRIAGQDHMVERLNHVLYRVPLQPFFQVNPRQAEVLFRAVGEVVQAASPGRVLDLYAGVGAIALQLAAPGREVVAVEREPAAVAAARANAELNGTSGLRLVEADAAVGAARVLGEGPVDVAVLDPPRRGCAPEALRAIADANVPLVVLVSCHPGTLARDCAHLAARGYRLGSWRLVDLFPHTAEIEALAVMRR